MEKQEAEEEESAGPLNVSKVSEEVEGLLTQVEIWGSDTKSILDLVRHQDHEDGSSSDILQVWP